MKTLTTSQAVTLLLTKGFKHGEITELKEEIFNNKFILVEEYADGKSYIKLLTHVGNCMYKTTIKYSKLNASQKKQFISEILTQIN